MEGKQLEGKRYSRRKADGGEAAGREEIQYSRRKAYGGEAAGREEIQ